MGGILGLCTGFSIITAVEFFYWFTVRIAGDHYNKKNKISPESSEDKNSSQEEQRRECHKCTKLEMEINDVKQKLEKQKEISKQEMEVTKQHLEKQKESSKQQKEEIESLKQQMARLENLLKSNV